MTRQQITLKKKVLFLLIIFCITYILLEILVSFLYLNGVIGTKYKLDGWYFNESYKTFHFDKIRGYYLTQEPSRHMRITDNEIEFEGVYKGNNFGFPDRDDFKVKKELGEYRIAVFGDSFTSAQFIKTSWPDKVEDLLKDKNIKLYNFSVDGGGLANWYSVIEHFIKDKGVEFDMFIFAVFKGDLFRGFSISEHRGFKKHTFYRCPTWDEKDWPKTKAEAVKILKDRQVEKSYILSNEEFEYFYKHRKLLNPKKKEIKPHLLIKSLNKISGFFTSIVKEEAKPHKRDIKLGEQKQAINKISKYIKANNITPIVVSVPMKEEVFAKEFDFSDVINFSNFISAKFLNGVEAFEHIKDLKELKECYFKHDAHWNQKGSDVFADFMLKKINETLPQKNK